MSWQLGDFGAGGAMRTYRVQSGDSLSKISMKFYGDYSHVQEIADENGIVNVDRIKEGQTLRLPGLYEAPSESPVLVPLPQPTPPTYDLPYTRPIALPVPPKEIPYTQPIQLPAPTPTPTPTPTPPAASTGQPKSISLFAALPKMPTDFLTKKYAGVAVWQWGAMLALAGLGLGMLGSPPRTATNPRKKRRR